MPADLIKQQDGVLARSDLCCDFGEVGVHRLGVAWRQNERRTFTFHRRIAPKIAEDIGRCGALVVRRRRARAASGPTPDLVLLADTGLVDEPDFYIALCDRLIFGDPRHSGGKCFLKSSITPSACA